MAADRGVQVSGERGQLARTAHKRSRHRTASQRTLLSRSLRAEVRICQPLGAFVSREGMAIAATASLPGSLARVARTGMAEERRTW